MSTNITDVFCDFLNAYCTSTVWNEPQREYRHNIKLNLQESRPQINVWSTSTETVTLPTSGTQYFVYMAPLGHFAGLDVRSSGWQSATTLLSEKRIHLRFHDSTGKWLYSPACWLRSSITDDEKIFIAVETSMLKAISDTNESDIFIGVYFDSDEINDIETSCHVITQTNKHEAFTSTSTASFIYLNGYSVKAVTENDLQVGDYLECITDRNIIDKFSLDLSNDNDARTYISSDGQSKYIIHIPRAKNPTNLLISHDTCDFYIYPRNLEKSNLRGRYFHRAQGIEKHSFIQITHNDFGVPTALVDQFRGFIGTDEVILDCYIRNHSRTKKLVRDKNYIDYLYQLTDTQILDFLENVRQGDAVDSIPFWSANHLEQSKYIAFLKDTSKEKFNDTLDAYTNALGYINTASLLSKRIHRFTGIPTSTATFTVHVALPLAYQWRVCPVCGHAESILLDTCSECGASDFPASPLIGIVSINGIKVPFDSVVSSVIEKRDTKNRLVAHLSVDVTYTRPLIATDEIVVEIHEAKSFDSYVMSPTATNYSFWYKTNGDYKLFAIVEQEQPEKVVDTEFSYKYVEQNLDSQLFNIEQFGDLSLITFDASCYGKKYLMQSTSGSYLVNAAIQPLFSDGENLVFMPEDDAYITAVFLHAPTAENDFVETDYSNGIDVYKQSIIDGREHYTLVKGFDGVDIADFITTVGINKKRIRFPESTFGNTYMVVSHLYESQPIVTDQPITLYLNGRYLVEDVDFHKVCPGNQYPYQVVIHNVSYLKDTTNTLECHGSESRTVSYDSNFVTSDVFINSKNAPALFYNTFTQVYTDGNQLAKLSWQNGRLENVSTVVPTRFGALYSIKTDIPPVIRKYLNEDILNEDLANLAKINAYFATLTADDPKIYPIYYSHRLYSVYLNSIIDDVLDGTLTIPAETDVKRLTEQYLMGYEYLKKYDLPLIFEETNKLDINGNPTGLKEYKSLINRTFIDVYPSYKQRLVPGTALYAVFNALIDANTPTDAVVDTVAVDTSVDDNQGNE